MADIVKINKQERKEARGFLKGALLLIPNFLKLLYRLFKDKRVPTAEKAFVVGAIAYVLMPLDFIPDVVPFVGQVDDLYLVSLTVLRLLSRTDGDVMREHWDGEQDIAGLVEKISRAAQYVLPERIRRVLLGRVEIGGKLKGSLLSSPAAPESIDIAKERKEARR